LRAPASSSLLAESFERLRLELSTLLHQDLDFPFCCFEFLAAGIGKTYALFKKLERLFERQVATLELFDDLFELLQAVFKFRQMESPRTL